MNERRYFDAYHADGYYLSDHQKDTKRRMRTWRDELFYPSCPVCYVRVTTNGDYCDRHQDRQRRGN